MDEYSSSAQIFSLDVAALSDQLDISQDELLAGLQGKTPHPTDTLSQRRSSRLASDGSSLSLSVHSCLEDATLAYVVCLVVSTPRALCATGATETSLLELSLRQLVVHHHCARIVVCVTDDALRSSVDMIVRAVKTSMANATAINILHSDHEQDDVSAVRHACMYVDATTASDTENQVMTTTTTTPLVIQCLESRVFAAATIDELVHQQQNAAILTDGLTRAVVLVDTDAHTSVGIWVCSLQALLDHCEVASAKAKQLGNEPENDDGGGRDHQTSIEAWLPSVLGALHCETVIATAEFNWEELQRDGDGDGNTLVLRFEPVGRQDKEDENSNQSSVCDEEDEPFEECFGSESFDWTKATRRFSALALLQAELESDGISAALFSVPTSVVCRASDAPLLSVDMAAPKTASTLDEQSPLLSSCSRTATVLSEIDLEGTSSRIESSNTTAHAYLIQVDRPASCSPSTSGDPSTPELIFAFPDASSPTLDELDNEGLPPVLRIRKRSDARLPSSVTHITLEAVVLNEASVKLGGTATRCVSVILHVDKQVPLVGYLILITALCAVSSQGAVLDLLVDVPPLLKLFWRMSGVSLTLLPFAITSFLRKGLPRLPKDKQWLALGCVVAYASYNAAFLVALSLTSIGHVYIFANSHSLILVVGKLLRREPLGALELLGAALGFSGGVVTTLDRSASPASTTTKATGNSVETQPSRIKSPTPLGDLVAFTGAFAGVAYLLSAKKLRAALGVRVFLFVLATGVALLLLPILLLAVPLRESTHATHGLIGWIHHLDIELYLVLVGSVCGTMGFLAALKYFDPLVVSVTMLTEPVVATVLSIFMGVERVPGWPTFVGGLAVIAGCLLVLLATHTTSQQIDVSDRLVKTPFTSPAAVLCSHRDSASPSSSAIDTRRPSRRRGTYGSLG